MFVIEKFDCIIEDGDVNELLEIILFLYLFSFRRGTGSNLPMAMKYRTLKETYKDYVGVFRSHIHGRGLYCTKDIEAG